MRRGEKEQENNNRAEELRKRRSQRSQQRVTNVSSRVVNPVLPPRPVTFRGNTFGTPVHRQSSTRARRQFYVTMDQAGGAELRLPAIPLANPGWRIVSFILVALAVVGIFSMMNSPVFRIYTVEVTGVQRLTAEDINAVVDLNNLSIIEVNAGEVQEVIIRSFPELMDVELNVQLPNVVSIRAVERQPVMAFQRGEEITWVDPEGVLFPARGDAGPLQTIIVEGELPLAPAPLQEAAAADETSESPTAPSGAGSSALLAITQPEAIPAARSKIDPRLMAAAQGLGQLVPPEVQLVYHSENGIGWNDPQGWAVYIGRDLEQFEAKFATYQEIANKLTSDGQRPIMISVAHLNAPFYRLEQ